MAESKPSFLRLEDSIPPKKFEEMARKDLGETEELKEDCLRQLRFLIKEHKLPCISADDFLLRFLRFKKFDTNRSIGALRNYVHRMPDLHKRLLKLKPEILETCLNLNIFGILPYRDAKGRLISFCRPDIWNRNMFSLDELAAACFVMVLFTCEKASAQVMGIVFIAASESLSWIQMVYLLSAVNLARKILLNCVPIRYSGLHGILDSTVFAYIFAVISPLMPKKLAERIVFHREPGEKLFQDFPRNILPDEFGGTMGPVNADHLKDKVMDYFQKFKDEHHLCTLCTNA